MGLTTPRVYLDSCLVIYLVEEHSAFFKPVQRAIEEAFDTQFCISPLVELECLVGPLKLKNAELVAAYEEFFSQMIRLDMPDTIYRAAAQLRANHGVKTPDALHLATAFHHNCDQLWTNDDRLARASQGLAANVVTA